jgi:pyruvate dehydrogenase E2 component (dihydrolipoamide acetyltransferase)
MPQEPLKIPQIGEGLQEARVVAFLKKPGDSVKRDEPIYQMETDKAVMDVESPFEGTLVEWLAKEDDVLAIGADIGVMETSSTAAAERAPAPAAVAGTVSLTIPSIGEGLQEARVVAFLKQPGDAVKRDEHIYQMETDKAVMDVESPYEGTLLEWTAKEDDVLAIGAEIGRMTSSDAPAATAATPSEAPKAEVKSDAPAAAGSARGIPPRTKAYAKKKGIAPDQLGSIPAEGSKLMPEDIDRFLAGSAPAATTSDKYTETEFGAQQRILASRMVRGSQLVVPGTMTVAMNWEPIHSLREEIRESGSDFQPSIFTMFSFAAAKACAGFPAFRSTLVGDSTVRTYNHIQLGIAVSLPEDRLVIAKVENADTLSWNEFAQQMREQINQAREGNDQADESVTLSLTNMQAFGIRDAVAVVVPPSVATIFLGETFMGLDQDASELKMQRQANLGITFDHRLINGVGAAEFQNTVKANVENIRDLIQQ